MFIPKNKNIVFYVFLVVCIVVVKQGTSAKTIIVDQSGNADFTSIQAAINITTAGDTVFVKQDSVPYYEKINFTSGGDSLNGYITLMAFPGDKPIIDGTNVPNNPASYTDDIIYISNLNYIRVKGFILRNVNTNEGSGIRVYGFGSHIELIDNEIYNILGGSEDGGAMGITIYGANDSKPITDIVIDSNFIHDCDPAWSEALTLNGNVKNFKVIHNTVQDVNNIGIDFIGGETWLSNRVVRNGICAWNKVYRANSSYGDGYAAGIYVDGGKNILVENNIVSGSDIGMEIGAENQGIVASGIVVRDNLIYKNNKAGLAFGGYASNTGRVRFCHFYSNTLYDNDLLKKGNGELWIQYADSNIVENNIFYANSQSIVLSSWNGNKDNTLDYNLWYSTSNMSFIWNGSTLRGLSAFQSYTKQGGNSVPANPEFVNEDSLNFQLTKASPAVNSGDPNYKAASNEVDMSGNPRIFGNTVDIGAYEFSSVSSVQNKRSRMPESFEVYSPYPNPFNGITSFKVNMRDGLTGIVEISVYSILGEKVKNIYNGRLNSGQHIFYWNGSGKNNSEVSSGVYFVIAKDRSEVKSSKVILLK